MEGSWTGRLLSVLMSCWRREVPGLQCLACCPGISPGLRAGLLLGRQTPFQGSKVPGSKLDIRAAPRYEHLSAHLSGRIGTQPADRLAVCLAWRLRTHAVELLETRPSGRLASRPTRRAAMLRILPS